MLVYSFLEILFELSRFPAPGEMAVEPASPPVERYAV
jgi:hypothetical protein